jgi:hypothetical protein
MPVLGRGSRTPIRLALALCVVMLFGLFALRATPASADISLLSTHWLVQSTANTGADTGADVSAPSFNTKGWIPETTDDAGGGLTEIGALAQNGLQAPGVPNPKCSFAAHDSNDPNSLQEVVFSDNMRQCWGQEEGENRALPTNPLFAVPWWFRAGFTTPHNFKSGQHMQLIVNGIVGEADVWVNGTEVATSETVSGDYTQFTFDITGLLSKAGRANAIAFEVMPNQPATMFTLDNVDWTQIAPDHNSGIQFPVQLDTYGSVSLSNAHVVQDNAPDMSSSALTVKGDVSNPTSSPQTATLVAQVRSPQGKPVATVQQTVTVPADTTQTVVFDPSSNPKLTIDHPQLWWPWQMGGQPLYSVDELVTQRGRIADTAPVDTFGIRTVQSVLTQPSDLWPDGVREFIVNNKPFVWRTGGWGENEFLRYSSKDAANQIQMIKSLGLQGIRTEGKEMPDDFYEQMDRAGMIVDGGFQCCDDSWQPNSDGSNLDARDFTIMAESALRIGERLRNHPSVFNYSWSDNAPIPEQEIVSLDAWKQADFDVPFISSADENSSQILGPSGEKEGPYDYGAPSYWYTNTSGNDGGFSTGFDSESSPGDTVPTLDSLNRFLSPSDQSTLGMFTTAVPNGNLTPDTCFFATNEYHMNWETQCPSTNFNFGTMNNFDIALYNRYGSWLPSQGTPTATGDLTAGSALVTNPVSTGGSAFTIGTPVSGTGIPAGTTLQDASTSGTATLTSGSNMITNVTVLSGEFTVGSAITASNIPAGTTIVAINGNVFTLSAAATRSRSGVAITGAPAWTLSAPATATGTGVTLTGKASQPLSGGAQVAPGEKQFVEEAQPQMYEADRAQFEAFIDHSTDPVNPATGTDFWLVNHAFPTLLWGLYNTDYDANGGFFGAKKANESLHALYVFDNSAVSDNNTVTVDNLSGTTQSDVSVESKVYDLSGRVLDDQIASRITLPSQGVMNAVITPNVPAATTPPTPARTYFVELIMRQHGRVVDHNVYWVSTQQDRNTSGSPVPTFANADAFANLTELQQLPRTTLRVTAASHPQAGLPDGQNAVSDVTITNTGHTVAFFVRVDLRRGDVAGRELPGDNEVLPVSYSDNDITLWPGESQTIQVSYDSSLLHRATPIDSVFAWNVPYGDVTSSSSRQAQAAQQAAANQHGVTALGLADGQVASDGNPQPSQENTPAVMSQLASRVTVTQVHTGGR